MEKEKDKFGNFIIGFCFIFVLYLLGAVIFNQTKPRIIESIQTEEEYEYEQFLDSIMEEESKEEKEIQSWATDKKEKKIFKVTATIYRPNEKECDSDPLITADNSKIDLKKLERGQIKWIAVSRDLRKHFPYGKRAVVICEEDPSINGIYEIRDTMNERWYRRIDFLRSENDPIGKWENVKIALL